MPGLVSRQVRRAGQAGQGVLARCIVFSLVLPPFSPIFYSCLESSSTLNLLSAPRC